MCALYKPVFIIHKLSLQFLLIKFAYYHSVETGLKLPKILFYVSIALLMTHSIDHASLRRFNSLASFISKNPALALSTQMLVTNTETGKLF